MLDFERPFFLLLAPVALGIFYFAGRNSLARWTKTQAMACNILRVLLMLLLIVAAAGPRWLTQTREAGVLFLRDVSASIGSDSASRAAQFVETASRIDPSRSAEIDFAASPVVRREWSAKEQNNGKPPDESATDTAASLDFAAAVLPSDRGRRIVLLTDGRSTAGRDLSAALSELRKQSVEVDVVPLEGNKTAEVAVGRIDLPQNLREGEVFDLPVQIHSSGDAEATATLYQNNLLAGEQPLALKAGANVVTFPRVQASGRFATYDVILSSKSDTRAENNKSRRAAAHGGAPKVLVVDREPTQSNPLAEALRSSGFEVEVRPPEGMPTQFEDLEGFDLVVLANAPSTDFSDEQLALLRDWVKNFGGGLVMTGGENSFGAGGYYRTPLASALPVRIEREEREDTPVTALLVILDRSGSMAAQAGGQTKMSLADEGAVLAMDVLQPKDLFGVFAVDTRVQDVVPLAKITDKNLAAQQIMAITAGGGGIYIYTSLAEAYPRLRDAQAKIKHAILFSDAADAEEKNAGGIASAGGASSLDLAAAMLGNQITLSVVALGTEQDRDAAFLRQLAAQGGGRFYLTSDASALPRLFTLETMRATQSSLREEALLAVPASQHSVTEGIDWSGAPPLLGYNVTQPKPGAEIPLTTEGGDPLLAMWRFGLGEVVAFTSDAQARWAGEWLSWPGYAKFWLQLARHAARRNERRDLEVTLKEKNGILEVSVDAISADGKLRNNLPVMVTVAGGKKTPESIPVPQTGPGRYQARIPVPTESTLIAVGDGEGKPVSLAWAPDYPPEFLAAENQEREFGKEFAGSKINPAPEEVFRPVAIPATVRRDLSVFLLAAALLLFPVDIWLRRREWGNSLPQNSPAH